MCAAQVLLASGVPVVGAGFELSSPLSMGPEHLAAVCWLRTPELIEGELRGFRIREFE